LQYFMRLMFLLLRCYVPAMKFFTQSCGKHWLGFGTTSVVCRSCMFWRILQREISPCVATTYESRSFVVGVCCILRSFEGAQPNSSLPATSTHAASWWVLGIRFATSLVLHLQFVGPGISALIHKLEDVLTNACRGRGSKGEWS
jgi:hypothetical protein